MRKVNDAMDYKKMEENGTIDYYIELKKYIQYFLDRNYPLTKDDMKSLIEDSPSENAIKRVQVQRVLTDSLNEILEEVALKNEKIIADAYQGKNTKYTIQDYRNDIEKYKQVMMEKLWNFNHQNDGQKDQSNKNKSDSDWDI